jgi:hypothetical protein
MNGGCLTSPSLSVTKLVGRCTPDARLQVLGAEPADDNRQLDFDLRRSNAVINHGWTSFPRRGLGSLGQQLAEFVPQTRARCARSGVIPRMTGVHAINGKA